MNQPLELADYAQDGFSILASGGGPYLVDIYVKHVNFQEGDSLTIRNYLEDSTASAQVWNTSGTWSPVAPNTGYLKITKRTPTILSGTFSFDAVDTAKGKHDTLRVREGRFDLVPGGNL